MLIFPMPCSDIKEHVAITIFSATAADSALAISIFAVSGIRCNSLSDVSLTSDMLFVICATPGGRPVLQDNT